MPDDRDYEWLRRLIANPGEWTDEDLSAARFMIANQRRALEGLHPNDVKGRQSALRVLDELETAVRTYLGRDA